MKEIKLRFWDTRKKRFNTSIYYLVQSSSTGVFHVGTTDDHERIYEQSYLDGGIYPYKGKRFILCQYTGIQDKNGKEIYEGYIIKSRFKDIEEMWIIKSIQEFDWWKSPVNGFAFDNSWVEHEVIGNIYENPNLLTDQKEG